VRRDTGGRGWRPPGQALRAGNYGGAHQRQYGTQVPPCGKAPCRAAAAVQQLKEHGCLRRARGPRVAVLPDLTDEHLKDLGVSLGNGLNLKKGPTRGAIASPSTDDLHCRLARARCPYSVPYSPSSASRRSGRGVDCNPPEDRVTRKPRRDERITSCGSCKSARAKVGGHTWRSHSLRFRWPFVRFESVLNQDVCIDPCWTG